MRLGIGACSRTWPPAPDARSVRKRERAIGTGDSHHWWWKRFKPIERGGGGQVPGCPEFHDHPGYPGGDHSCNGQANQTWTHSSSNQLTVTLSGTTLCLDANSGQTAAGTKVQTWSCNGQTNQQWQLNSTAPSRECS
jgi:hypothetical protein